MAKKAVKTQGTELFFLDPTGEVWTRVGCPTTISLQSETAGEIDITCLSSKAPESMSGFGEAGSATFDIMPNPADPSHARLFALKKSGETLEWAIGWADGEAMPDEVLPKTRTWNTFAGHLTNFPFDFQQNDAVRASGLTINISGSVDWIPREAP